MDKGGKWRIFGRKVGFVAVGRHESMWEGQGKMTLIINRVS